jgi:hypothetical protein
MSAVKLIELRASLDAVAGALATSDLDGLLAAESRLQAALADIRRVQHITPTERGALRTELVRARAALARCQSLGALFSDVTTGALRALGGGSYDRAGVAGCTPAPRGVDVKARL